MQKITDTLVMLDVKSPDGRTVRPVFAWDDTHRVLIDTGYPGQEPLFEAQLNELGFSCKDITDIIITHQDMDHIGCVKTLMELSGARVLMHPDEAPYLTGEKVPLKLERLLSQVDSLPPDRREFVESFRRGYEARRLDSVTLVPDGARLPFCGGVLAIHTPGHTPGHLCLTFEQSGTLVAGDALNMKDGKLTGPEAQHSLDIALAVRSLERLKGLPIRAVATYHGGLFDGDIQASLAEITEA